MMKSAQENGRLVASMKKKAEDPALELKNHVAFATDSAYRRRNWMSHLKTALRILGERFQKVLFRIRTPVPEEQVPWEVIPSTELS
jgi:hypothetical protein